MLEVGRRVEKQGGMLDRMTTAGGVQGLPFLREILGFWREGQPGESLVLSWGGKLLHFALLGFQKSVGDL